MEFSRGRYRYRRYFTNQEQGEIKFYVIYIDGIDVETANRNILQPIIQTPFQRILKEIWTLSEQVYCPTMPKKSQTLRFVMRILRGESVLLMDKSDEALLICTAG